MGHIVRVREPATDWDRGAVACIADACPECGSTTLDTIMACDDCGRKEAEHDDDLCAECRDLSDESEFEDECLPNYRMVS